MFVHSYLDFIDITESTEVINLSVEKLTSLSISLIAEIDFGSIHCVQMNLEYKIKLTLI